MARGQGAVKIVDETKKSTSSNANDLISSMDERIKKLLNSTSLIKKRTGKVVSVQSNQTYATVSLVGYDDTQYTFLNKTGEMLSVGDYVKIECSGEDLTSGYISEKFGISHIENLNGLLTVDTSSLVNAINELFTYVSNGKNLIADAITYKEVPTSATAEFDVMVANILKIGA